MRLSTASGFLAVGILKALLLAGCLGSQGCVLLKLYRLNKPLLFPKYVDLEIQGYEVTRGQPTGTLAGVGITDITPPPGYPTGGDGPAGTLSRGYWTRIWARAFYFEDANAHRVALVTCELFALPGALHDEVARRVNTDWDGLAKTYGLAGGGPGAPVPIAPTQIVISATHTHQGPGNFTSAGIYTQFSSAYIGFDRKLFDFLADRIAGAIVRAAQDAHTHSRDYVAVRKIKGNVYQPGGHHTVEPFLRNRTPLVFALNPDRDVVMNDLNPSPLRCERLCQDSAGHTYPADDEPSACEPHYGYADVPGCPRLRAVDPSVTLLEVRRGSSEASAERIGMLVFFAAHPTVLMPDSPFNSSDFTGYAVRHLERKWSKNGSEPVIGFFNGTEGDVTARRLRRDIREVERIGTLFANSVETIAASNAPSVTSFDVSVATAEAQEGPYQAHAPPTSNSTLECLTAGGLPARLAETREYGVAGLGGGEGDRAILYDLGWREGVRGRPEHGQGPKRPGLDSSVIGGLKLSSVVAPPEAFPSRLPVSLIKIGPLWAGTFPGELTTTMGYRIRKELVPRLPDLVLIGLANEYVSYVATPEEYAAQEYVGASTIFGPQEGPILQCTLRNLIDSQEAPPTHVKPSRYPRQQLPLEPFGPTFCGDARDLPGEETEKVLLGSDARPAVALPWFEWDEVTEPYDLKYPASGDFGASGNRRVEIREWTTFGGGSPGISVDDDRGFGILTMLMDGTQSCQKQRCHRRYAAIWAALALDSPPPDSSKKYVFAVTRRGLPTIYSVPFALAGPKGNAAWPLCPAVKDADGPPFRKCNN